MGEKIKLLSARLQMLADMVTPGNRVADVGCDHGFLSIYLVQAGISPSVIAMDVRKGPLAAAGEHIRESKLGGYIETRLSDGLAALEPEEVDTVICAGMGGRLMERILREGSAKAVALKELILQPQSEIPEFRLFLRKTGYEITDESIVYDGGKYYFAMRAIPRSVRQSAVPKKEQERLYDKFGEKLLLKRHPVLEQYLRWQENAAAALVRQLEAEESERAKSRLSQVWSELEDIRAALGYFEGR